MLLFYYPHSTGLKIDLKILKNRSCNVLTNRTNTAYCYSYVACKYNIKTILHENSKFYHSLIATKKY